MSKAVRGAPAALVVAICFLIAAIEGYDIQAFGVSAPKFGPEFGLNPGQIGLAASAAMLGLVLGALIGGWAADRAGRRPVLFVSVAIFAVFSVITAFVGDGSQLLWVRLITGLGFGGAMPNLIAIASEISKPERRAATVTTMFCGMPAGGAAVSLLSQFGGALDWRTIFLIGGGLPLILLPVIFLVLPETKPSAKGERTYGYLEILFGGGRWSRTLLLWATFFLTLVVLYLMLNWLPSLVMAKNFTAADGASAAMWFNLIGIPGSLIAGFVVDRAGFRWPLLAGYLLLAACLLALANTGDLRLITLFSAAAGFFVLGAQYSLFAVAPALYPPDVRGAATGAAVAMGRIGSIVGPLLAGELRQAGFTANEVFQAVIGVALAAGLAVALLAWRAKGDRLTSLSAGS